MAGNRAAQADPDGRKAVTAERPWALSCGGGMLAYAPR